MKVFRQFIGGEYYSHLVSFRHEDTKGNSYNTPVIPIVPGSFKELFKSIQGLQIIDMLQQEPDDNYVGKWIVNIKGKANSSAFEISVVREDNAHGIRSYGWFDEAKLLISHNGGPCSWPLTERVWNKMVKLANEVADELNLSASN